MSATHYPAQLFGLEPVSRCGETGDGGTGARRFTVKEEVRDMALLDLIVDTNFRSDETGRLVVFLDRRRHVGYVVKSVVEELRIRSFLKMFYFAHLSILILGYFLAFGWARELSRVVSGRFAFASGIGIALGIFLLVAGIPYWLLWRSYKKAFLNFVSAQDEVVMSETSPNRRPWIVGIGLIALAILLLVGVMSLARGISVAN